jgi:hypothetical protein
LNDRGLFLRFFSLARLAGNMWRYDTIYETYTSLAAMPTPYVRFAYAATDSTVYMIGGLGGDIGVGCWDEVCNATGVNMATVDDAAGANPGTAGGSTFKYDVDTNVWSAGPALNVPRADGCSAVVNGKVYVVGAWQQRAAVLSASAALVCAALRCNARCACLMLQLVAHRRWLCRLLQHYRLARSDGPVRCVAPLDVPAAAAVSSRRPVLRVA